ncbi:MAG: DUF530 family protein [Candidatus Micrarchaeia archaeon]|jgi:hypothetical protein
MKAEMENSYNFILHANEYLDSVEAPKNIVQIEQSIKELDELRKEMLSRGFSHPSIGASELSLNLDSNRENNADIKKQLSIIKYTEYLKRITLKRVKIALSSFLISKQLINTNPNLITHLPIEGNYIGRIIKTGRYGLTAFTRMNTLLSGRDVPQYLIAKVQYEEKGKIKNENLKFIKKDNLEERIKREYGETAKILKTRIIKKPGLITSNSARTSIILSFISKSAEEVKKIMDEQERGKIKEYNTILRQNGLIPDSRIDLVEGFENVKNLLIERKFITKIDDKLEIDEELKSEITRRTSLGNLLTEKKATNELLLTIYKFYLLNSKTTRQEINLLPTLSVEPEDYHLEVFNILEYGENKIENAKLILKEKIESEKLSFRINEKIFGASFFAYKSNKDLEWCSNFFDIKKEELEKGINEIKLIMEKGRGKDFLEAVKDANS